MPSVNTYQVYISGSLDNLTWSGDIDPQNHRITPALGSGVIVIDLSNLLTAPGGQAVSFDLASPITFIVPAAQPCFVAWTLLSPVELLITDMNSNPKHTRFTLNTSAGQLFADGVRIDPTIVNTYVPPPADLQTAAASRRRIA